MKISHLFRQYIWLVNNLSRGRGVTFSELQELWLQSELSGGQPLSRATFNRHKDAIEEIFGLYIVCDHSQGYRYAIGNRRVLSEDSLQNWMLSTLTVSQLLHESCALQERIIIEPILADNDIIHTLLDAMKSSKKVCVLYQKYNTDDTKEHTLAPLCIKLFRQRWYLLGQFDDGFLAVFAIDRMISVEKLHDTFTMDDTFHPSDYFDEFFGVLADQRCPLEDVVLRIKGNERHYVADLPLHHTQRLSATTDTYDEYTYRLRVTPDFISHLMSMGEMMEVRAPQWLGKEIARRHRHAARQYGKRRKDD